MRLNRLVHKLPLYQWFLIGISGKVFLSAILLWILGIDFNNFDQIVCQGDCLLGYTVAADNILNYGVFTIYPDLSGYTGRMPGYEPFLILSSLVPEFLSRYIFVILIQVLIAGVSVYFLAETAYVIFKQELVFYLTFFLYLLSSYNSLLDIRVLSESLAISFFIISLYLVVSHSRITYYILAGFLIAWSIFLRQYIFPTLFLLLVYVILSEVRKKNSIRQLIIKAACFILPFFLLDSLWMTRNFALTGKLIPLVDSYYAGYEKKAGTGCNFYISEKVVALADFISSWGGDIVWWNEEAEITAFHGGSGSSDDRVRILNSFPDYIYTSAFNKDSLANLQELFLKSASGSLSDSERQVLDRQIIQTVNTYRNSFINENKGAYYLLAPGRLFKSFLFHSGTYNLSNISFNDAPVLIQIVKLGYSGLYIIVLLGGLVAAVLLFVSGFRANNLLYLPLTALALYIPVVLPVLVRRIEYRHFSFAYPFFTILLAALLIEAYLMVYKRRENTDIRPDGL